MNFGQFIVQYIDRDIKGETEKTQTQNCKHPIWYTKINSHDTKTKVSRDRKTKN